MYEYPPEVDTPPPQPSLLARLLWVMIVLVFVNGIMCNVLVLSYIVTRLLKGVP